MKNLSRINSQYQTKQPFDPSEKKTSLSREIGGLAGGMACGWTVHKGLALTSLPFANNIFNSKYTLNQQEKELYINAADRMIKKSGIGNKGFKDITIIECSFFTAKDSNAKKTKFIDYIKNIIKPLQKRPIAKKRKTFISKKRLSKTAAIQKFKQDTLNSCTESFSKKLIVVLQILANPFKVISDILTGTHIPSKAKIEMMVSTGFYNFLANNIMSNMPKSLLHEAGHAINSNKNFFTKIPMRLNILSSLFLTPFIILNALFSKKPEENQTQNKDKSLPKSIRDFTHKHIGLTVFALNTPLLIEEGMASLRAIKFANNSKIMSAELKTQHNKFLRQAFCTYIIGTIAEAVAVKTAVVVKDKIMEHNKTKRK